MKYRLIIFDIDGTIVKHISSWRYIHEELGLWDKQAFRYQEDFLAGKITYRKFCELDAAHWKGIKEERIRKIFKRARYSRNAVACIKKFKKAGFKLAAISTGLQYMADRAKEELGFDYVLSNRLNSRGGLLTGGVKININHGAKGMVLRKIVKRFDFKPRQVICVGDSAGDIPMMKPAGYSIAFNSSSEELSKIADYNCAAKDFKEVFDKIMEISFVRNSE
ncbi:MAG: HAD family phosphatase [Candidatus Omnitrophota bacterium]